MDQFTPREAGSGPAGKNLDSVNRNSNYKPPQIKVSDKAPAPKTLSLIGARQKTGPKKILKKIFITIVIVIVLLGGSVVLRAANLSQKIFVGQKTTFFGKILDILRGSSSQPLIGEDLGQINILLLGIGGEGHDGPYLTDTMILAQIRPDTGEVTMTSIPRDYLIALPGNLGQSKINEAFTDGFLKNHDWNEGGQWARQVAENISGLSIPYFAVIDFSGFEKAIDQVGGVNVTVDRTFTDYQYPDSGTGYLPPQTFTAGPQTMTGKQALIFARSRHAAGIEGSDFSRSLRQQKIISAFKEKALGMNLIKDASTINQLLGTFADHFHTNLGPGEILHVYNLLKNKDTKVLSLSLDPDTHLICPEILASNGAYVLTPCPGKSEADVQNYFKNSFSIGKIVAEKSLVWLASSTGDKPAYDTAFRKLTDAGLTVYQLNYSKDNLAQTLLYQANPKPATAEFLVNELKATEVNLPPPGVTVNKDKVDIIIVLGQNASAEAAPKPYIAPPARIPTTTPATTTPAAVTIPSSIKPISPTPSPTSTKKTLLK